MTGDCDVFWEGFLTEKKCSRLNRLKRTPQVARNRAALGLSSLALLKYIVSKDCMVRTQCYELFSDFDPKKLHGFLWLCFNDLIDLGAYQRFG